MALAFSRCHPVFVMGGLDCLKNRYLVWFSAAFFAAAAIPAISPSLIYDVIAVVIFVAVVAFLLSKEALRRCAVVVVGAVCLSLVWQMIYFELTSTPRDFLGGDVEIIAEITSYSERNSKDTGICVKGNLKGVERGDGKTLRAIIYINDVEYELAPGDRLRLSASIKELENTDLFASKTYYKSRYTDVFAFARDVHYIEKNDKFKAKYIPQYLAKHVRDMINAIYPDECAAFLRSLIMGDKDSLSPSFLRALEKTGLLHTISVSGMHIAFLIGMIIIFSKNKYLRLVAIPVMLLFALMVGATQSALRAVIMNTVLLVSVISKREYDALTSISFAALVLVAINPHCASDTGFLLSFSATLGIILLAPKMRGGMVRAVANTNVVVRCVVSYFAPIMATSFAALIFTTPILSLTFGGISLIAPLSNVLLYMFITLAFILGIITVMLGFISIPLAKGGAFVVTFIYKVSDFCIRTLARIPFAEIYMTSRVFIALILFLCFIAVFGIAFGRKKIRLPVIAVVILVSIGASGVASYFLRPSETGDRVRFDVLDVGQGQCIVAETRDSCIVIDCGGNDNTGRIAVGHIRERGIDKIDALIITHAHTDHAGDVRYLMESVPTEIVYAPQADKDEALLSGIAESAEDLGTTVEFVGGNLELSFDAASVKLISLPEENSKNENGLVIIISDGEFDVIVTGDLPATSERVLVEQENLPDCEVYVVGHHGSSTSSSMKLLNEILPEVSVVSVGAGNSYNHPSPETLTRLQNINSRIYRTDLDGEITFYSMQE